MPLSSEVVTLDYRVVAPALMGAVAKAAVRVGRERFPTLPSDEMLARLDRHRFGHVTNTGASR